VLAAVGVLSVLALAAHIRNVVAPHSPAVGKVAPPETRTAEPGADRKAASEVEGASRLPALKVRLLTDAPDSIAWLDGEKFGTESPREIAPGADPTFLHKFSIYGRSNVTFDFKYAPASWPATVTRPESNGAQVFVIGSFHGTLRAQCNIPAPIFLQNRRNSIKSAGLDLPLSEDQYDLQLLPGGTVIPIQTGGDPVLILGVFWNTPVTEENVESMVNRAQALLNQREYLRANRIIDRVLAREPENERAKRVKQELDERKKFGYW